LRRYLAKSSARRKNTASGPIHTDEQLGAIAAIEGSISRGEHFTLNALAGTGKTTVAAHVAALYAGAFFCAPTAKAASVLTTKTGVQATTVHSAFCQFVKELEQEGEPSRPVFRPAHSRGSLKSQVLLLDECSMISKSVSVDILAAGVRVVAIGDPGQLPPVEGQPFFTSASFELTEIHRQAIENPIIRQAHVVRSGATYVPDGDAVPVINRLTSTELRAADVVLTGRRQTRMRTNAEESRVLGLLNPLPRFGEPLICLRNAPKNGLCNGTIYYASSDLAEGDKTIGISTDAGDLELHAQFLPPGREYDQLDLPPGGWMTVFAFGYALTAHQAQGSEFDSVLLIDEWFQKDRIPWLYTGITRAKERITIASKDQPS
jgi:exodeoxyribonuclease-5